MKRTIIFLLVLVSCFCAFSYKSIKEVLPTLTDEELSSLMEGNSFEHEEFMLNDRYLPKDSLFETRYQSDNSNPDAWTNTLTSFIPYTEEMKSMSDEEKLIHVYNTMNSISSLKGITYRSFSHGNKQVVLFEDSYMISNPNRKGSKIENPVIDSYPPSSEQKFGFLKDCRFGGNVYVLDYFTSSSEIFLDLTNNAAMKYMGFTCLPKESLSMCLDAVLTEEGILVSGLATVVGMGISVDVLITSVHLPSAFMRRITALSKWFTTEV